ncbi:relaxase/mobilization nuclease domain-containing protein [Microterricola pindariensis]|uniref:relaxase/mobilization nuclease domain-containing protein n=1 Tax=Microterricola pindariensis TaxID=478010 RepID=UPI001057098D|nr:hypothetical protein [Microterricola pindariensis]
MSIVHVKRIAKTRSAVDYELYGAKGSKRFHTHKANGTDRVAAMTCDHRSPEEFVARAEALTEKYGRKIEARSIIQSFKNTEFDPRDPEQVRQVNELGYEYAKRLHPNSDVLVITHIDGHGGHPHNHIKVINHDDVTNKALQGNHLHWMVAKANDQLMREHELEVLERKTVEKDGRKVTSRDQGSYWEQDRESSNLSEFDKQLGDKIEDALVDSRSVDTAHFREVLAENGIELVEEVHRITGSADGGTPAHESTGWTYKGLDETGPKRRTRRRKASSLSSEFTHKGAHEVFKYNQQRSRQQAQVVVLPTTITEETDHGRTFESSGIASRGTGAAVELEAVRVVDVDAIAAADRSGTTERDRGHGLGPSDGAELEHAGDRAAVDLSGTRDKLRGAIKRDREAAEQRQRGRRDGEAAKRGSDRKHDGEAGGRRDGQANRPLRFRAQSEDKRSSGGHDIER